MTTKNSFKNDPKITYGRFEVKLHKLTLTLMNVTVNFKHRQLFLKREYSSEYIIPYEPITSTAPRNKYLYLGFQVGRLCYMIRKKIE
jgi:hypothetical protein